MFSQVCGEFCVVLFFFFNMLFYPACSVFGSSLSKGSGTTFLASLIKGFIYSSACWELGCCGVALFREATAHPGTGQSCSSSCGVTIEESIARAGSSLIPAISVLLLTTNLEGKLERTFAFVSSHLFQMQRIYLGFFFGPSGGKVSLS